MEVADKCDYPNAIHRWCRFKREVIKKNQTTTETLQPDER